MTVAATVATPALCPHCSAETVPGAEFCGACGMALPSAAAAGPRVVGTGGGAAQTAAGMKLRADELLATAQRAARSLRSIGIVNLAFAGVYIYLMSQTPRLQHDPFFVGLTASMGIAGAIYVGLYFLARVQPLTATVTGLVVYLLKWGVDIGLGQLLPSNTSVRSSTSNYYVFRLLMVIYLVRGISAAVKHRRLQRQQLAGTAPLAVLAAD